MILLMKLLSLICFYQEYLALSRDASWPIELHSNPLLQKESRPALDKMMERVKAGMRNAKAKGKVIGRVRKRNSVLIESLLEAQLSYREIARIAKCSHGSVHAQYREKNDGGRAGVITAPIFLFEVTKRLFF